MKLNLLNSLRASIVAASAASLTLIAPAFAGEGSMQHKAESAKAKFSQLDKNSDNALNKEELKDFAEHQQMDAEQLLSSFDLNQNNQLEKSEFESVTSAPSRVASAQQQAETMQSDAAQEDGPDGAKIKVDQKPTQVTVNKPAAQVTIEQPKPKVTITTQDPKVEVEQAEPRVSVQQPKPEVSVDQAKPEVEISDAEPEVEISNAEPQVDVNQAEAEVSVDAQEQQASTEPRTQQGMQMDAASIDQQSELYSLPLNELRTAEIVDQSGQSIGNVEEIVIKRDASEAGLIISTTNSGGEARHVYRTVDDFSVDGELLVLNAESGAQALEEPQGFVSQEFMAVPLDEGTLEQILSQEGLSAR